MKTITIPTPYITGDVNCYLFLGDVITMVDTGPKIGFAQEALEKALRSIKLTFEDIQRIVVTHAHWDHYGLAKRMRDASKGKIFVHHDDAEALTINYERGLAAHKDLTEEFCRLCGIPDRLMRQVVQVPTNITQHSDPVEADVILNDGDRIVLGVRETEVIHCPGHSPGSICFYDPSDRILFSGDHILFPITPNPGADLFRFLAQGRLQPIDSLSHYMESLKKILTYDIHTIFPAHGSVIYEPYKVIQNILEHHRIRMGSVSQSIEEGKDTVYEISRFLFPNVPEDQVFYECIEVVAHLELMEHDGLIKGGQVGGRHRYRINQAKQNDIKKGGELNGSERLCGTYNRGKQGDWRSHGY